MDDFAERAWCCLLRSCDTFGVGQAALPPDLRMRALGELVYVLTMTMDSGFASRPAVAALATFATAALEDIDWAVLARRDPRFYVAILTWHAFAAAYGDARAAHWRALAQRGLRAGALASLQLAPHRMLELWFLLRRAGLDWADLAVGSIYAQTIAGRRVPLPMYSQADEYALAHILFYLTDHGRQPVHAVLGRGEADRLVPLVRRAVPLALAEGRYDLLAELVIGAAFLKITLPNVDRCALRILHTAQDPEGWIVAREQVVAQRDFGTHYHATLVWALAATLLSAAGLP